MKADSPTCPDCGASLPAGGPTGLCAACLLKLGEPTSAAEDAPTLVDQSPANEAPGMRIGRYKLLEPIGEGGFGTVWMAEQEEPVRRRVALKIIKLGMDTRAVVARFEAERQALALMDHPHIAKVLDGGATESGRPYFVMELVRGVPITEYCDGRKLNTRERLELFIPVCQAVQHAHQKGIIHRDLKPSNILVTEQDGRAMPKVIDFGIAKATEQKLTEKTLFTRFNQMIGTPAYMSPEQAGLGGLDIDTRSDVYSLGVLLYELLTGRTPFDQRKLLEAGYEAILKTIRETEPPKPSTRLSSMTAEELTVIATRRSDQPAHLNKLLRGEPDWIVLKALEKDRNRRYETANGLAADLNRYLANEPVTAVAPSAVYRLKKWAGRNRLAIGAGSVVAAALLIGLGTSLWSLQRERAAKQDAVAAGHKERQARTEAERAQAAVSVERDRAARLLSVSQAEQGVRLLEQGDPIGLLHLLEARKSVEHLPEERLRRTLLWSGWMNSLPKPEVRVWTPPPGSGATPDPFSGRPPAAAPRPGLPWTATGSTNGEVALWEAGNGRLLTRFSTGNQRVAAPELSANGRLLVVNVNGIFQLWDLATVRSNQPPRRLLGRILRMAFDPPHLRVLTLANQGLPQPGEAPDAQPAPGHANGYQVQIWDSSAEPALITTWEGDRQDLANHQFAFSADGSQVAAAADEIALWDARSGQRAPTTLSTNAVSRPRDMFDPFWFSPDGRWLWEVRRMACLRYDLSTGELAGEPITGLHRYQRPWLAGGGEHLVVSLTNGFQVLHLDRGEPMGPTIAVTADNVRALALSPDGQKLATAGPDRALRVWSTTTGQQAGPTHMPPTVTSSASFTADGKGLEIVSRSIDFDTQAMSAASRSGPARIISLEAPPPTWITNLAGARAIGFRGDGELLTYTKSEGTLAWRHPTTSRSSLSWAVAGSRDMIGSALNPAGTLVAAAFKSGEKNSEIRFWETGTGRLVEPSITWTNQGALAFSPDGQTLAGLGGFDGSGAIQLWDVASRQPRAYLPSAPKEVSWLSLWFSPDGRFIAARNSYAISVWDVAAGRLATGGQLDFYLAISDDWKWALGQELLDFTDPRNPRTAPHPLTSGGTTGKRAGMALSPDGRLRAAEAGDRKVRLWDNFTERPAGHEMTLANPARQMSFSPDGRLLSVFEWNIAGMRGGNAMSLRLWETSTGLPCGPAVPLRDLPVEWLFDREVRWLTQKAPFDTTETLVIQLPDRVLALSEMERQSWLLSGCRLDVSGNVEVIPDEEFLRLEATGDREAAAGQQAGDR